MNKPISFENLKPGDIIKRTESCYKLWCQLFNKDRADLYIKRIWKVKSIDLNRAYKKVWVELYSCRADDRCNKTKQIFGYDFNDYEYFEKEPKEIKERGHPLTKIFK